MKERLTQIDLAKAYGKHSYQILDLNYREKILNHPLVQGLFTIGKYFVIVGNVKTWKTEFLGGDIEDITGFGYKEIKQREADFLMTFATQNHVSFLLEVVKLAIGYLQQRPIQERERIFAVYFFQARKKNGDIITIQQQSIPILFDANKFPYVFTNIITDITHLGLTKIPQATVINRAANEIFHVEPESLNLTKNREIFTEREKEILRLLVKGYSSKQIANQTGITFETARTHRKKILKKAGLRNTTQLVGYAVTNGLV